MNRFYTVLFLILSLALAACEDDSTAPPPSHLVDDKNPLVHILAPSPNTTFRTIQSIDFYTSLSDNHGLQSLRLSIIEGSNLRVVVDSTIAIPNNTAFYTYRGGFRLPWDSAPGIYRLLVEVKDTNKHVTKDSITFNVVAPVMSNPEFVEAFFAYGNVLANEMLGWHGIYLSNEFKLDEALFSLVFRFMVNKDAYQSISEAEWNKIMADFGVKGQSWASWDVNRDGFVSHDEFDKGLSESKLFAEWDSDKDNWISNGELPSGIFGRWDHNQDGVLSREEYQERFYTYLIRP